MVKIKVRTNGDIADERTPFLLLAVQFAQAFGKDYLDAASRDIDTFADILRERQKHFAGGSIHDEQRRAGDVIARGLYVAYFAQVRRGGLHRTGRRGKSGR